jgi:hypothetical protein
MNLPDKISEMLIGLGLSGLLSAIVWAFRWVGKVEDRIYAMDRDIKHLQNKNLQLSKFVADLDIKDEKLIASLRKQFWSVHERTRRLEVRVYIVEIRVGDSLTQAIDRTKATPLESKRG